MGRPRGWSPGGTPLWIWILQGWMIGALLGEIVTGSTCGLPAPLASRHGPRPGTRGAGDEGTWPCSLSPRELRCIPGIGDRRAVAIARECWNRQSKQGPFRLVEVPGIGPVTAASAEAWRGAHDGENPPGLDSTMPSEATLPERALEFHGPHTPSE